MNDCIIEETDATNELILDKNEDVQPLTAEEIEKMKKSGMHASVRPSLELSLLIPRFLQNILSPLFPYPGHNQPSNFLTYYVHLEK
jgi:hypothetical protein